MNTPALSRKEIEAYNVRFSDTFAQKRFWNRFHVDDPIDDLRLFFSHIPGKRMLDVGCGWARYVQRFLNQGLDYVGIDYSNEMLNVARQEFPELRFELASISDLTQFSDGSFDGLWCSCVFEGEPKQHMPDILLELRRLLVDGGVMSVITPLMRESCDRLAEDLDGNPLWVAYYDEPEFKDLLEQAGFLVIESVVRHQAGAMSFHVRK